MKTASLILIISALLLPFSPRDAQAADGIGFPALPEDASTAAVVQMSTLWMMVWGEMTKKNSEAHLILTKSGNNLSASKFELMSDQTNTLMTQCRMLIYLERCAEIADPKRKAESQVIMSQFYTELGGSIRMVQDTLGELAKAADEETRRVINGHLEMLERFSGRFCSGRHAKWKTR